MQLICCVCCRVDDVLLFATSFNHAVEKMCVHNFVRAGEFQLHHHTCMDVIQRSKLMNDLLLMFPAFRCASLFVSVVV